MGSSQMVGQTFGRYKVLEHISAGAMGVVYRAHDERLNRDVAIKVLPLGSLADEAVRRRFRSESLTLSRLNHPNIATVFDFDTQDGTDLLVMELVPGITLDRKLSSGPLPEKQVVRFGLELAQGLAAAHEQGIVHRDLKPGNLIVTPDGRIKILDFGLAKFIAPTAESAETLTQTSEQSTAGTLPYMAPEQLRGETPDVRSDVWAAGAVLYEMTTGQRPFREELSPRLIESILTQPPVSPRALNARTSPELDWIILKCLEKDPENRYQSARDLEVDLRRLATSSVSSALQVSPTTRRLPKHLSAIAFISVLVITLAVLFFKIAWPRMRGERVRIDSLAVLPLTNLSGDPEQDYFADSMTEALIGDLSKIKSIRVVSRTSVMRYKSTKKPIPEIARELNVDGLVEGSVERSGNRVRITARLIGATTDQELWTEAYDRDLRDVLVLQDEVARSIVREIQAKLTPEENAKLAHARQVDPEAYQLYIKGRYFWVKRTADSINKAIDYFHQSIEKDPAYPQAYTGLADAYSSLGFSFDVGSMAPNDVQPKAKAAAAKALEIDDSLAETHNSLAFIKLNYEWDWPGSEREFKRALELNPGYANAHHWYAHLLISAGRPDESLAESNRALELDPLSPIMNVHLGWLYVYLHQYDKALGQLQKTLELDPHYGLAYWYRGLAYEQKGMYADALRNMHKAKDLLKGNLIVDSDIGHVYAVSGNKTEARKVIVQLEQLSTQRYVNPYEIALIYIGLGQKDQAFQWLEKAYTERSDMLVYLKVDPRLDAIRFDPRFNQLVRRVGIPQ